MWFHCMLCARRYFCIQRHSHANRTFFFFFFSSKQRNTYFFNVHLKKTSLFFSLCACVFFCVCVSVCVLLIFFSALFIPGEALYTHWVQRHAALALLFAFYSWLSWQAWCHLGSGTAGKCISSSPPVWCATRPPYRTTPPCDPALAITSAF